MDPEQTFIRVQERFSQMLTPRIRAALEYTYLSIAIVLFCILIVLHANYVQQPGCSSEFPAVELAEAQILQIKITGAGLWSTNDSETDISKGHKIYDQRVILESKNLDDKEIAFLEGNYLYNLKVRMGKFSFKLWKTDKEHPENFQKISNVGDCADSILNISASLTDQSASMKNNSLSAKEYVKAAFAVFRKKWVARLTLLWNLSFPWNGILQKLWVYTQNITGIHLDLDAPSWLKVSCLDKINTDAVNWLENKTKAFEPIYFYTAEKGYFLLPEEAKVRHNIKTVNLSISASHSCFGNRWQQLLINRMVGYDTILMNSLLTSPGKGGYLYNFHTKEFYNLSYGNEPYVGNAKFGDYLATKCGVLMMSLFVFFTATLSVSFTLRETQTRMLKFTVQLQHHARHRLPTFQLIFVHVVESLVFVPIMVGILFFLFEFYDDQLLAFMVLILVWLCELFTLISVRTPISMKFFPRFFLLYFLVFHIYFFSYAYGFSYLALTTTAAFMQHLILYFWNRFEVPALQVNWRSPMQQHSGIHITSSTILASTLHITRLNTRNQGASPRNLQNSENSDEGDSGTMNSFSSLLLWILGGAYSESFSSFLSIFRDQGPFNDSRNQQNHQSEEAE